jgi:sugar phosphate isomerase/epimerase
MPSPADNVLNRRQLIQFAGAAALLAAPGVRNIVFAADSTTQPAAFSTARYKIAACDWMMLKRQKLGAIQLAKDCGCDGLEVDMGPLNDHPTFDNELVKPEVRAQFLHKSKDLGIEFCSLAMSGFYAQSFPSREVEPMVQNCIDTMKLMNVKTAFLPLGVPGDLVKKPELRPAIVQSLRAIAPRAESAGVIIGIETALDAEGDKRLLDDVGSPAIRIYFNFSNAIQNNRDLISELRTLEKDRICQIHCTDQDGVWLENDPKIDMPKVKQTLDDMGWSGWLVIERSRDAKRVKASDVAYNFGGNARYLKSVFQ